MGHSLGRKMTDQLKQKTELFEQPGDFLFFRSLHAKSVLKLRLIKTEFRRFLWQQAADTSPSNSGRGSKSSIQYNQSSKALLSLRANDQVHLLEFTPGRLVSEHSQGQTLSKLQFFILILMDYLQAAMGETAFSELQADLTHKAKLPPLSLSPTGGARKPSGDELKLMSMSEQDAKKYGLDILYQLLSFVLRHGARVIPKLTGMRLVCLSRAADFSEEQSMQEQLRAARSYVNSERARIKSLGTQVQAFRQEYLEHLVEASALNLDQLLCSEIRVDYIKGDPSSAACEDELDDAPQQLEVQGTRYLPYTQLDRAMGFGL